MLFELPEIIPNSVETQKIRLEPSHVPDISTLNPDQLSAFESFLEFINDPDAGILVFKGLAGTGKTYTITKCIEHYLSKFPNRKMVLTAPTNKAVKVLYRMAKWWHPNVEYATVHSTLCLTERNNGDGTVSFVPRKGAIPTVGEYAVYVVDETSQLQDELFNRLEPYVAEGVKFIFMGDPVQIPPVNKKNSIPFLTGAAERYGWKEVTLSTIVRQALENPIVGLTLKIRKRLGNPAPLDLREDALYEDDKGVYFLDSSTKDGRQQYIRLLRHLFCSENFNADADFAKVVAWKNDTVNATNRIIRKLRYGPDARRIEIGEKLITNEPIILDGKVLVPNSEELEVISFTKEEEIIEDDDGDIKIPYYDTKVSYRRFDNSERTLNIQLVAEEGMQQFNEILSLLVKHADSLPRKTLAAIKAWADYFDFKRKFADVNYNYCLTAHKSQGSTYDNCIVIESDIDLNKRVIERNRIKYTAMSRPRHRLYIL